MVAQSTQHEEELVRRFQHGDDRAFDRLVETCSPRVYNLAYRLVGNADDAQDLAQEAFVRVYHALPKFKWESAFSTWLYRIVSNACYDELKRRRRRPSTMTDITPEGYDGESPAELLTDGATAADPVLQRERQQAVQQAITQLPEPFRLVLVLYDLRGLSYQEIADVLQQNMGTVKSRLNRARGLLREKLGAQRELFGLKTSQTG